MGKRAIKDIVFILVMTVFVAGITTGRTACASGGENMDYVPQNVRAIRHSNSLRR